MVFADTPVARASWPIVNGRSIAIPPYVISLQREGTRSTRWKVKGKQAKKSPKLRTCMKYSGPEPGRPVEERWLEEKLCSVTLDFHFISTILESWKQKMLSLLSPPWRTKPGWPYSGC